MSMIGKTLGHYSISTLIGREGMGEVYQAKDQKLGRNVAIKVLPEEFAKDTDRVVRFQRTIVDGRNDRLSRNISWLYTFARDIVLSICSAQQNVKVVEAKRGRKNEFIGALDDNACNASMSQTGYLLIRISETKRQCMLAVRA